MKLIIGFLFLHIHGSLCKEPTTPANSDTEEGGGSNYEIIEGLIVRRSTVVIASNIESLDESAMSGLNLDSENKNVARGSKKVTTIQLKTAKLPVQQEVRVAGEYYQPEHQVYNEEEGKHVYVSTKIPTNQIFYGLVTVGEPKPHTSEQQFLVAFDTGSANFWLPSNELRGTQHHTYNPELSKTSEPVEGEFKIKYGTGKTSGKFVKDTLKIGDICIKSQAFGIVKKEDTFLANADIDGILGLGYMSIEAGKPHYSPVFYSMIEQKLLEENLFTFSVKKNKQGEIENGELTFGRIDESKYKEPLHYTAVDSHDGFWMVGMKQIKVKGMEIASDAAVIDSGTNLIVGPLESVETLFSILGIKHENDELPTVDCESARSFPAITFTIGKLELTLESDYYIVESEDQQGNVYCAVGIVGVKRVSRRMKDEKLTWVLGAIFMYKYFTVFDYGHHLLGFAEYQD